MNGQSLLLTLALGLTTLHAKGESRRLDDSRSHTVPPAGQMQWAPQTRADREGGMETWIHVNIHIDTHEWVGRSGRIYMVLPREETSRIEAEWTTQGTLRSGRLTDGERALVFVGTVRSTEITDRLRVHLRSGPDWLSNTRRLNFHFEFDVDPAHQ